MCKTMCRVPKPFSYNPEVVRAQHIGDMSRVWAHRDLDRLVQT